MSAQLIVLTGYAGSGKSTIAKHLINEHGFTLVKFASPLKDMLRAVGLTDEHLEGSLKEKPSQLLCGHTPRHAMQTLGTEWGRNCIGPSIWSNIWLSRVNTMLSNGVPVVTDDCRFDNEMLAAKSAGAYIIQLTRPDNPNQISPAHESENIPSYYDVIVPNVGGINELTKYVDFLLEGRQ